jgi:hypothetical protein
MGASGGGLVRLALCAASVHCACVLPAPLMLEEEVINHPPYVAPGQVLPPYNRVVLYDPELDPEGLGLEFSTGPIGDPNVEDRLFWRWFYNYGPGSTAIEDASPREGLAVEQRDGGIRLRVRPCVELRPRFPDVAVHRVELVLADRPFLENAAEDPLRNQRLPLDAGQIRLVWFLSFDPGRCPL